MSPPGDAASPVWWAPAVPPAERPAATAGAPGAPEGASGARAARAAGAAAAAGTSGTPCATRGPAGGDAVPAADGSAAAAPAPAWAEFVGQALGHATAAPHGPGERVREVAGMGAEGRLVHPLWPFLVAADIRFHAGRPTGPGRVEETADRRAVWEGARRHLAAGLVALAGRTLVGELRSARLGGRLEGADGRERFDHFVRTIAARPALTDLLCRRHPVLARLLAERCLNAVAAATELLDRYRADRPRIVAAGLLGEAPEPEPGALTGVRFGLGDPHGGGRTVAVLDFACGRRLVYKPRPLGLHARWNELLGWFAEQRPELGARPVPLLPREGYGWSGFVPAAACASPAGLNAFYERLGAQLALLHAVDASDVHAENLIAAGDQPVVVDVETLFHPAWTPGTDGGADPAAAALAASLLRTAVLPNPLVSAHAPLDTSALGAGPAADCPTPRPTWSEPGTDAMRLTYAPTPWPGAANRPVLAVPGAPSAPAPAPGPADAPVHPPVPGAPADPADHVDGLLRGFRAGYLAIAGRAEELTSDNGLLSRFADEAVRVVARPSQTYAELLAEATEPHLLGELSARQAAFDLPAEETGHPHLAVLAPHEAADLAAGDIPVFTATPGARTLRGARGGDLGELLPVAPLAAARAKIHAMGPADLARQEWLIRASLATRAVAPAHRAHPVGVPAAEDEAATRPVAGRLLALAAGIGDQLADLACRGGDRANWPGLQELDGGGWAVLGMGMGLADGYTGTALFLAELARATGTPRYAALAADAVRPLPRMLRLLADHPELAAAVGPGGFSGLGGVAYATVRLAELLDDAPELTDALPDALTALEAAAADPQAPADVADGLAGALLAAHAVHAQTGLPAAGRLARELAARTAAAPRPAAGGFLRGHDGVAWALTRCRPARPGADAPAPPADDLSWCAGLAGTAVRDAAHRAAHLARVTAADRAPLLDLSLCHGELGVLEPLAGLPGPAAAAARRTAAARLLRSVERHGVRCGAPLGVTTPGLLAGLAGIGHGLLRLASGATIPSVLLLQPSGWAEVTLTTTERAPSPWTTTP
ncbi:type 2 lanthipeptide synthetase LanM family protein [Streptomyces sp. V4-01]|uniref:Type 2 lanthipeptide synthetase LanM family protein n=1 Tax=Actinacidiphila polyblastidii TaxID=3110430 RepID=A0ABU7PBY6_9ACTN|nr:type 2 lanthipeptide synthetase LanM family protein [Streptomyces sp. V4-01]